jgi:hypothetical protein
VIKHKDRVECSTLGGTKGHFRFISASERGRVNMGDRSCSCTRCIGYNHQGRTGDTAVVVGGG